LRALAVTDAKRSVLLPKPATVAESGFPSFEMSYWLGLMAPAGTPRAIVDRLSAESRAVLTTRRRENARANFSDLGLRMNAARSSSDSGVRQAALGRTGRCWSATAKSCFTRSNDRLGPGRDAQLAEYDRHVVSHRTLANAQARTDRRVIKALDNQFKHIMTQRHLCSKSRSVISHDNFSLVAELGLRTAEPPQTYRHDALLG